MQIGLETGDVCSCVLEPDIKTDEPQLSQKFEKV